MSTRMLIDARHEEETRVIIVKGNRVEDFDHESTNKLQLKGNIYLAKITRVEPSLQAAFVDYGENRHGFLAFSEIHPDYYQIPIEDRDALLAEEDALLKAEEADIIKPKEISEDQDNIEKKTGEGSDKPKESNNKEEVISEDLEKEDHDQDLEERIKKRQYRTLKRRYKIQEVIKKRQILLIQVTKEERGNKGAALTSYLSLAGRYSVLMPNSTHGGGISRKIANSQDRKRLKEILNSISIPKTIGVIIRTAGLSRTKIEIKRDIDYLQKIWNGIRELTLKSIAPSLIYEEGNLIKRTIRDLYDRDIQEVLVEGEKGYKIAKKFMTLLMPSHSKKVIHYQAGIPLFHRYKVESQLEAIYEPDVTLKSGGYLVINPTEALIAIDVNSGKSTKESHIDKTALKTNLEAAEEIARQLRLRDLAGLVVIDFIDMDERSHNLKIERKIKTALKSDRARIQVGRISSLGLMEISRQRLHPNLVETSTNNCPSCNGTGRVRTTESSALHVIRGIEEEGISGTSEFLIVSVCEDVAIYILNQKRKELKDLETKYGFKLSIRADNSLNTPKFELEKTGSITNKPELKTHSITPDLDSEDGAEKANNEDEGNNSNSQINNGRRRQKRGHRVLRNRKEEDTQEIVSKDEPYESSSRDPESEDGDNNTPRRRRRRGRRGGRHRNDSNSEGKINITPEKNVSVESDRSDKVGEKVVKPRRNRKSTIEIENDTSSDKSVDKIVKNKVLGEKKSKTEKNNNKKESDLKPSIEATDEVPKKKTRGRPKKSETKEKIASNIVAKPKRKVKNLEKKSKALDPSSTPTTEVQTKPTGPKKKGWWQRVKG